MFHCIFWAIFWRFGGEGSSFGAPSTSWQLCVGLKPFLERQQCVFTPLDKKNVLVFVQKAGNSSLSQSRPPPLLFAFICTSLPLQTLALFLGSWLRAANCSALGVTPKRSLKAPPNNRVYVVVRIAGGNRAKVGGLHRAWWAKSSAGPKNSRLQTPKLSLLAPKMGGFYGAERGWGCLSRWGWCDGMGESMGVLK